MKLSSIIFLAFVSAFTTVTAAAFADETVGEFVNKKSGMSIQLLGDDYVVLCLKKKLKVPQCGAYWYNAKGDELIFSLPMWEQDPKKQWGYRLKIKGNVLQQTVVEGKTGKRTKLDFAKAEPKLVPIPDMALFREVDEGKMGITIKGTSLIYCWKAKKAGSKPECDTGQIKVFGEMKIIANIGWADILVVPYETKDNFQVTLRNSNKINWLIYLFEKSDATASSKP